MVLKHFKNIIFVFLILFVSEQNIAQETKNSLSVWEQLLKDPSLSDEEKLDSIDVVLEAYYRSDIDTSFYLIRLYLAFAKETNFVDDVDFAHSLLASLHRQKGDFDSAIYYNGLAFEGYIKNDFSEGAATTLTSIANIYTHQSRYDLAIKNYIESIDRLKLFNEPSLLVNPYSSLAGLYFRLGNYDKAKKYWSDAQTHTIGNDYENEYSYAYRGFARVSIKEKKFTNAVMFIDKAFEIDIRNGDRVALYENNLILMELYSKTDNIDEFKKYQKKALEFRDIENPVNLEHFYEFSGDFHFKQENYNLAEIYYDSCISVLENEAIDQDQSHIESTHRLLNKKFYTQVFKIDARRFRPFYDQISDLSEEAENIKKTYITQELDAQYSLKEMQETNFHLDEQNKIYEELNQKNRNQIILLTITLGLMIGFLFYMVYYNRKIKKIQLQLKDNIEEKEFLFHELNHRVKNNLFIVNSFIGLEKRNKSEDITRLLTKIENRIHSLGIMHEILYKGEMKETIKLKEYLDEFIKTFEKTISDQNIKIELNIENEILVHVNKISYIGLIINELLTNSCKHAKIDDEELLIIIQITREEEHILINIIDNGKGLPDDFFESESFNLKIARGLTKQLKGSLEIEKPEQGSKMNVIIPNKQD